MKKFAAAFLIVAISLPALAEENLALKYDGYWKGMKVAQMRVFLNEKPQGDYNYSVLVDSLGFIKLMTKYWSVNSAKGKILAGEYFPAMFDTKWQRKKGDKQQVTVKFANNGEKISEVASPPEDRGRRPFVELKDKKNSLDPLSGAVYVRKKVQEIMESGVALPQKFLVPVFDSRRRFDVEVNVIGYEKKTYNGKQGKYIHLRGKRIPIAGFNGKELEAMKRQEPVVDVYLDNRYIPIWAVGVAPAGSATITLAKSCEASNCKL